MHQNSRFGETTSSNFQDIALTRPKSACPLTKSDRCSLDFVVNRLFMKLFKTSNMEVVKYCQSAFDFVIPSLQIAQKSEKFVKKFNVVHKCGI